MNSQKLTYYRLFLLKLNTLSLAMVYSLTVIIGFILIIVWFFYFYQPMNAMQHTITQQIVQKNSACDLVQQLGQKESEIRSQLQSAQQDKTELIGRIGKESALDFLQKAQELGFICKSYMPQKVEQKEWYHSIPVTIELVGPYHTLDRLLSLFQQLSVWCTRLNIKKLSDNSLLIQTNIMQIEDKQQ